MLKSTFSGLQYGSIFIRFGAAAAAVLPPFRLGDPALCGIHPLVTPY